MTPREIEAALDAFAKLNPPSPHWLEGDEADQGQSYCYECACAAVDAGEGEEVAGGYDIAWDEDSCCHCATCGRLLSYTLSKYGVLSELEHFKENSTFESLSRDEAFHIARMVEEIDSLDDSESKAEVLRIAATALAAASTTIGSGT